MPEAYRQIHNLTDFNLDQIQGLLWAADAVMDAHPGLQGPEPQSEALRALVSALHLRVRSAIADQATAWQAMWEPITMGQDTGAA